MPSTVMSDNVVSQARVFGEPQLHTDGDLFALAFAPDGSLWSVEEPGVLRHWNAANGQQLHWLSLSDLETVWTFSRDVRLLASASDDLTLWDISSGQVLTALPQSSWVTALAFGRDPSFVAAGNDDGTLAYWDAAGHHLVHEFRRHKQAISAVAISDDGTRLAAADEDCNISLWDLVSGKHLGDLTGHTDRIPALAWHPSGNHLVSVGWDTTARIWNVRSLEPEILLNVHAQQVTGLAVSPDGALLVTADSAQDLRIWDFASRKVIHQLKGPPGEMRCLGFSADGNKLAASGDHAIQLLDTRAGKAYAGSGPRPVAKTFVAVDRGGSCLASNGGGLAARIWNVGTRQSLRNLPSQHPIHALAFNPDGSLLAGAAENSVQLWDADGNLRGEWTGPEETITRLAFSPDGSVLASASSTGMAVWVWRVTDGEPVLLIPDALDGCTVETLAFHPNGRLLAAGGIDWLATGGSNGAISLWDLTERCEVGTILGGTISLAFHPSGKRLASTSLDQSICIWDAESLEILAELTGHDNAVTCVAYSPDGKWLASGGEDRTLRLWNEAGEEVGNCELDSQVVSLAFSADGQFLFTGNANTTCCQLRVADLLRG
ncbi:MAG: WD40 repeat domain-containing protein [Planctomycetes bacterium]|nr:WD40 repeat domain-containing protein [Planctomycetota bacterium]